MPGMVDSCFTEAMASGYGGSEAKKPARRVIAVASGLNSSGTQSWIIYDL